MSYLTTRLSGVIFIALVSWGASTFATDEFGADPRIVELRSHMLELEQGMERIDDERNSEQRRLLLTDHMQSMHEAVIMIQEIITPAMDMWAHALDRMDKSHEQDVNSDEHMALMTMVIEQMQVLIDQTSQHRRALKETQ